jgi:hypothetical protein
LFVRIGLKCPKTVPEIQSETATISNFRKPVRRLNCTQTSLFERQFQELGQKLLTVSKQFFQIFENYIIRIVTAVFKSCNSLVLFLTKTHHFKRRSSQSENNCAILKNVCFFFNFSLKGFRSL